MTVFTHIVFVSASSEKRTVGQDIAKAVGQYSWQTEGGCYILVGRRSRQATAQETTVQLLNVPHPDMLGLWIINIIKYENVLPDLGWVTNYSSSHQRSSLQVT